MVIKEAAGVGEVGTQRGHAQNFTRFLFNGIGAIKPDDAQCLTHTLLNVFRVTGVVY